METPPPVPGLAVCEFVMHKKGRGGAARAAAFRNARSAIRHGQLSPGKVIIIKCAGVQLSDSTHRRGTLQTPRALAASRHYSADTVTLGAGGLAPTVISPAKPRPRRRSFRGRADKASFWQVRGYQPGWSAPRGDASDAAMARRSVPLRVSGAGLIYRGLPLLLPPRRTLADACADRGAGRPRGTPWLAVVTRTQTR